MTYSSRGRSLNETLIAAVFGGFLTGFIFVLCIGNYYRAKRAMERQKQRRLARLSRANGSIDQETVNDGEFDDDEMGVESTSIKNMNTAGEQQSLLGKTHTDGTRQRKREPFHTTTTQYPLVEEDLLLNENHNHNSSHYDQSPQLMSVWKQWNHEHHESSGIPSSGSKQQHPRKEMPAAFKRHPTQFIGLLAEHLTETTIHRSCCGSCKTPNRNYRIEF